MSTDHRYLVRAIHYHIWATDSLLVYLANQASAIPGSHDILAHHFRADKNWMRRCGLFDGEMEELFPAGVSRAQVDREWAETRPFWIELPERLAGLELDQAVTYTVPGDGQYTNTLSEALHQVLNHGIHHRAQIQSRVRSAGHTPMDIDMIFWLRVGGEIPR